MPAVSLVAMPGRRNTILDLACEIERRGFSGIYTPSINDAVSLCTSLAHVTERITFGTSIQPIYLRHPANLAESAAYVLEVSGGRFVLGIGVSHGPVHSRLGVQVGKPLSDAREFVAAMRAGASEKAPLPPVVLATLRTKMLRLAVEVGDGAVWANAARSHMAQSLSVVPDDRRGTFFVGNMIPTVIDDDRSAAAALNRRTLTGYVTLPNYRNYWKEAGYVEEMESIEAALTAGERDRLPDLMSDRWLADVTLFGSASEVRDGYAAWLDAGVSTPILAASSTSGGQAKAIEELFAAFG